MVRSVRWSFCWCGNGGLRLCGLLRFIGITGLPAVSSAPACGSCWRFARWCDWRCRLTADCGFILHHCIRSVVIVFFGKLRCAIATATLCPLIPFQLVKGEPGRTGGLGDHHFHLARQHIELGHFAGAARGFDMGIHARQGVVDFPVMLMLKGEAAHQPSAGAGNFLGIQCQSLCLRHVDGNRRKGIQEGGATERSTANVFGSPTAGTVGTVRTLTQCNLYQLVSSQLLQRPGIQVVTKD